MPYKMIDLFAGCGGLSCGLEQAGFTPWFVNEIVEQFANTYKYNHHLSDEHYYIGDIAELNKHIDELNERIVARTTEAHDIEIKNSEARNKRDSLGEFIKELDRRIQNIDSEIEENKRLISEGNEYVGNKQIEYDKLNGEIEGVNEELSSFRQDISEKREEMQRAIGETNELRLELRGLEGDHQRAIQDKERLIDESRSLTKEIESNKETVGTLFLERQELEDKIKELEANSKSLVEAIEELKIQKDELSAYKQKLSFDIDEQTKNLTAITATKSAIEKRLTASEMKKEQAGEKIRELYNRMWDEYEVTYVIAKGYEKLDLKREELIKEEKRLRSDIRALGNVNMNAVEEFRAVSERYDFLTQNRRDIIETENKLVEIIDNLNDMMGKQFAEQFVIIRENFAKTFVEMFGGGKADLKLSDSEDILNSGIEIIVQPPGKALQNMMLLSGGEKALTAIALLFGILKMKPSPFCILDEIEAALDDANVYRYANYLNNFTDNTQFIVITHRKGTMEAADRLYGVTMQEQGVSKLVSVNFESIAEVS